MDILIDGKIIKKSNRKIIIEVRSGVTFGEESGAVSGTVSHMVASEPPEWKLHGCSHYSLNVRTISYTLL